VRQRITLTILAAVVAALVVSGIGTLGLARYTARHRTEQDLRNQTQTLADTAETVRANRGTLAGIGRAFRLSGLELIRFNAANQLAGSLPAGVPAGDLDVNALRSGTTISGVHNRLVWSASPVLRPTDNQAELPVVVATRQITSEAPAFSWLVISSIVALAMAAALAAWLSKALSAPLRTAEAVTARIATGDLSARLPDPHPGDDDATAHLARSVNAMAETLERSRGIERQFLLSISHDLRTPLTSIRGYAEGLADGAVSDSTAAGTIILAEARRLERLVQDLLDLARLESRRFRFDPQPLDLVDLAAGTVDGFRPEAEDAGVALVIDAIAASAPVTADLDRMAQVTANLVENAMKYTRSRVTLQVSTGNGWARLDVVDDGPGIAPEDLPHVFERLYVSRHQPQRKESGSGLGLAIVRELVTAMGGQVAAATDPGGGARLAVLLPLAPPD
jgi:two-component system, OmpR family, sensor kinase